MERQKHEFKLMTTKRLLKRLNDIDAMTRRVKTYQMHFEAIQALFRLPVNLN